MTTNHTMRTLKLARYTLLLLAVFFYLHPGAVQAAAPHGAGITMAVTTMAAPRGASTTMDDGYCNDPDVCNDTVDCNTPCSPYTEGRRVLPDTVDLTCGTYGGGADSGECDDTCADICGGSVQCDTPCDHVISDPKTCGSYDGGSADGWCDTCGDGACDIGAGETACNCPADCGDGTNGCGAMNPDFIDNQGAWCFEHCAGDLACNGYGYCVEVGFEDCGQNLDCDYPDEICVKNAYEFGVCTPVG